MKAPMSKRVLRILADKRAAGQLVAAIRHPSNENRIAIDGKKYRITRPKSAATLSNRPIRKQVNS